MGIVATVVLAFTGGIAFSTSVLENFHQSSPYRILVLVIGLVLINLLFGLFDYIDRLVRNNEKANIKPLLLSNVVISVLLVVIFVFWSFGAIELRNNKIENRDSKVILSSFNMDI